MILHCVPDVAFKLILSASRTGLHRHKERRVSNSANSKSTRQRISSSSSVQSAVRAKQSWRNNRYSTVSKSDVQSATWKDHRTVWCRREKMMKALSIESVRWVRSRRLPKNECTPWSQQWQEAAAAHFVDKDTSRKTLTSNYHCKDKLIRMKNHSWSHVLMRSVQRKLTCCACTSYSTRSWSPRNKLSTTVIRYRSKHDLRRASFPKRYWKLFCEFGVKKTYQCFRLKRMLSVLENKMDWACTTSAWSERLSICLPRESSAYSQARLLQLSSTTTSLQWYSNELMSCRQQCLRRSKS